MLVLSKHRLNASSGHQDPPHILPHHGAVDSRLTGHAGKRWGGLEVSKTPARVVPGRKIRIKRNTNARSFLTSRPNLGMPPATYSRIRLNKRRRLKSSSLSPTSWHDACHPRAAPLELRIGCDRTRGHEPRTRGHESSGRPCLTFGPCFCHTIQQ